METRDNELVLRQLYQAFGEQDFDTISKLIEEDAVWEVPGRAPISGTYRGKQAIFSYFAKLAELSGGTFRVSLKEVPVSDTCGVAVAEVKGFRNGKEYNNRYCLLCQIVSGKIREARLFNEDQYAFDDFWSRE